jgi:hypothetical protein
VKDSIEGTILEELEKRDMLNQATPQPDKYQHVRGLPQIHLRGQRVLPKTEEEAEIWYM